MLATLAVHWNALDDAVAVSVPTVNAAGEASGVTGLTEARYAAVAEATRVEAV